MTWSQHHEYVTASSNDTDHYGERVYQGEIIREHVETQEEIERQEQIRQELRHKNKRKVKKEIVTYVSETESDSADELIDVVDHRNIKKEIDIIVERPSAKTTISAKERIAVPVRR